ncbi:MAG: response regulator transcription factor [Deltaproteobacteria bacterium]|nr:response regulator transcription factor [Deltaproteobacteria bacterium]
MSEAESILVVEDERNVGSTLYERLKQEGFDVTWVCSVKEAEAAIAARAFDMALLDVGLPDGSGFALAAVLRKRSPATAAVFLTAHGDPEDRIRGLELGAEDYVTKPFHVKELLLRIRNILRRMKDLSSGPAAKRAVRIGRATVRFASFAAEVRQAGKTEMQPLTHKECALLKLLYEKRGVAVSRDEILDKVWSDDDFPSPRTVDNFILRLRRIVEYDVENPQVIRSIRGVGYQLVVDAEGAK